MKSLFLLAVAAVVAAATPAAAQMRPGTPPPTGVPNVPTVDGNPAFSQRDRADFERGRRDFMDPEEALAQHGEARVSLAERVAALVEEGKCREARDLANAEGDREMALRVRQICRPRRGA